MVRRRFGFPFLQARNPAFTQLGVDTAQSNVGASSDGSLLVFGGSEVYRLDSSMGVVTTTGLRFSITEAAPALDRSASRIILNNRDVADGTVVRVYDSSLTALGDLPTTTMASVLSPDGTKAFTYDSSSGKLRTFDLSGPGPRSATLYPEIGAPGITLAGSPGAFVFGVRMTISPDGHNVFLAGETQVAIQPVP